MLVLTLAHAANGQSVQPTVGEQIDAEQDPEYDGLDVTRPQNKFEARFVYRTSGTANQVTQGSTLLRLDQRFDLQPQWKLGILTELPVIARETVSPTSPNAEHDWGIGDAYIEPTLIRNLDPLWSLALGTRVVAPTAGDTLGTRKLQVLPFVAVRYEWAPDLFCAAGAARSTLQATRSDETSAFWNSRLP
jgi:hypothetical protein